MRRQVLLTKAQQAVGGQNEPVFVRCACLSSDQVRFVASVCMVQRQDLETADKSIATSKQDVKILGPNGASDS